MIPLLLILLIVLATASWWRPIIGLCAVTLLLPSYLWRWTIGGVPTTFLELSLYAVCVGVAIAVVMGRATWSRPRWSRQVWILIVLWSAAWILATAFSPDLRAGAGALKAWWIDAALFVTLAATVVRSESERIAWMSSITLSGAIVAAGGFYQIMFARETLQEGRLSSFFAPVANYAAMFIAPIFVFTVAALTQRRLRRSWWLFAILMAAALATTLSYGGYIAAAAGLVVVWVFLPPSKVKKVALGIGLAGCIGAALFLSTTKNFDQHFDAGRSSGKVREQIWVTSWALVQRHPLFGIGPNQFEAAYRQEIPKHYFPPLEWQVAQPHQLWLALWLEGGILALTVAVYSLFCLMRALWHDTKNPARRSVSVMTLSALVVIIVHGFVDTPVLKNDLMLLTVSILLAPFVGRLDSQKTN